VLEPSGTVAAQRTFDRTMTGASLKVQAKGRGFHTLILQSSNTPASQKETPYTLRISYSAPQNPSPGELAQL
jgi:hypothetical protein